LNSSAEGFYKDMIEVYVLKSHIQTSF